MTEPVKRYWHIPNVGFDLLDPKYYEDEPGYVHHDDYASLEQECSHLREERDSFQRVGIRTMGERDAALKQVEWLRGILHRASKSESRAEFMQIIDAALPAKPCATTK